MKSLKLILLVFFCISSIISCTETSATIESCQLDDLIDKNTDFPNQRYFYNADDRIEKIEFGNIFKEVEFEYQNDKVSKVVTTFMTNEIDSCLSDSYAYVADKISAIEHRVAVNTSCTDFEIYGNTTYSYTSQGDLAFSTFQATEGQEATYDSIVHFFDAAKNVLQIEQYSQNELKIQSTFKYDEMSNPLEGYFMHGKNNKIEEKNIVYDNSFEITFTYTYTYNELGIPIEMTEFNSLNIYTSKDYCFNLTCK